VTGSETGRIPVAHRFAGILLAAGRGARFGGAKLMAPLPAASHGVGAGTPVGVASCRHLVNVLPQVIAVVRPGDLLLAERLAAAGARVVECARADDGMGASLACGVAAAPEADGWIVALADMPWIAPATIDKVTDALRNGADIAAPVCHDRRGHPVGFARRHFQALASLCGDDGARSVVAAHVSGLRLVAVEDEGILRDVDTATDLRA
jgi:molybdenum cofactor cytidylyltransferase